MTRSLQSTGKRCLQTWTDRQTERSWISQLIDWISLGADSVKKYKLSKTRRGSPVDDRPSTDKLHNFVQKKKRRKWHVTCDIWHVTRDMWHVTCDMWHVTCLGGLTFSQNFSSLALTVCDLWYYKDILGKGWLNESMNEWMNDEAVCRTAPATPGLSTIPAPASREPPFSLLFTTLFGTRWTCSVPRD